MRILVYKISLALYLWSCAWTWYEKGRVRQVNTQATSKTPMCLKHLIVPCLGSWFCRIKTTVNGIGPPKHNSTTNAVVTLFQWFEVKWLSDLRTEMHMLAKLSKDKFLHLISAETAHLGKISHSSWKLRPPECISSPTVQCQSSGRYFMQILLHLSQHLSSRKTIFCGVQLHFL